LRKVLKRKKRPARQERAASFFWFFHSEVFSSFTRVDALTGLQAWWESWPWSGVNKRASDRHRRPVLTSETTKRKSSNIFHCALFSCYVECPIQGMLFHYTFLLVLVLYSLDRALLYGCIKNQYKIIYPDYMYRNIA
jgi:hypothetical protein